LKELIKVLSKNHHGQQANFYIRPGSTDLSIIEDVRIRNFYLDKGFGVFNAGDIVIDIGGHIGAFAIECAIRGASVKVYEPGSQNFQVLKANIKVNNFEDKITAYNIAVSDKAGNSKLYIDSQNAGSHSLLKKCVDHESGQFIEVKTIAVSDVLKDGCKLLKLDCEGSEYKILIGADLSKVEKIVAELHIKEKNEELVNYLQAQGFDVVWHFGKRMGKLQGVKKNTVQQHSSNIS
jgi:FkbM family methyltransferase